MGYADKARPQQTVQLSAGYTATIRKLTKRQFDEAQSHLLIDARRHVNSAPGEQARLISESSTNSRGYTTTLLVHAIVSWDLDGDDDKPLPVTRENIENELSTTDAALLVQAIDALMAGPDPNSSSSGRNGSS